MRTELQKLDNQRMRFTVRFERYGRKTNYKGYPEVTVLLTEIKDQAGKLVTDHLWFARTKGFQALGELREGDLIEFHARVREYMKGYRGRDEMDDWDRKPIEIDYRLSHPTRFKILQKGPGDPVPVPDFQLRSMPAVPQAEVMPEQTPADRPQKTLGDY